MKRFLIFLVCTLLIVSLAPVLAIFPGPLAFLAICVYYGWVVFAFIHYRQVRRQELLHLITTAVDTQAPLAPSLYAYLLDRSSSPWRKLWNGLVLLFVFTPVLVVPAYLIWRKVNFDQKVYRVARRLDQGYSLHEALYTVGGVASRETLLAVAVGQQTGRLSHCLHNVPRWQAQNALLELVPRVLYPLMLLPILGAVFFFHMVFIVPRFQRIFDDFGMSLPWLTEEVVALGLAVADNMMWIAAGVLAIIITAALLYSSGSVCWYVPVFGRLYRMRVQSRILSMLAILLDAGKTLPEALNILAASGYVPIVVRRRLDAVRLAIEQGQPLPAKLLDQGLLPRSMAPLLQAAERSRSLIWVLGEMGVALSNRMLRISQRIMLTLFPLVIFAAGAVVGVFAIAMFLPLIELMTRLTEL
jgi:type II secretory pathway component PulF